VLTTFNDPSRIFSPYAFWVVALSWVASERTVQFAVSTY
jgi:hypothetical protein